MESTDRSYGMKAWKFPDIGSRSDFESAVDRMEQDCYSSAFLPENIDEQNIRYRDGLAHMLEKLPDTVDGNFELVKSYRSMPASKARVMRDPAGFAASILSSPEPYRELYVVDTVKGAAVAGDEEMVEHFAELMTGQQNRVVDMLLE